MVWASQELAPSFPEDPTGNIYSSLLLFAFIFKGIPPLCPLHPITFHLPTPTQGGKLWSWGEEWVWETCNLEGMRTCKRRGQELKSLISPLGLHLAFLCLEKSSPISSPGEFLYLTSTSLLQEDFYLPQNYCMVDPLMPSTSLIVISDFILISCLINEDCHQLINYDILDVILWMRKLRHRVDK